MTTDPRRASPTAWLWEQIAAQLGTDAAEALRREYLARWTAYNQARRNPNGDPPLPPRATTTKAKRKR